MNRPSTSTDLVPANACGRSIPIAHMRSVYRCDEVSKRLTKLPAKDHESLRSTYERMLEKGPERFQVKPSGLPAMDHLYDEMPNFHEALDDIRRQLALCHDSRDALEITPMLLLGPPGVGKTHFAREVAQLLGTGMGFVSMSSLTAGWVLSGASSQWKGARPGKVFETLVDGQYANPRIILGAPSFDYPNSSPTPSPYCIARKPTGRGASLSHYSHSMGACGGASRRRVGQTPVH
jgi:ATP-dependent Lon protease